MGSSKIQVLKKEKEARDIVNNINSVCYDIFYSYSMLVGLYKQMTWLSKNEKQRIMQDFDKEMTVLKNLLLRLNNMFELSAYDDVDWRRVWNTLKP